MFNKIIIFSVYFISSTLWAAPVLLKAGEQRCLKVAKYNTLSVGNPEIARVLAQGPQGCTMVKGVREGTTDLWLFYGKSQRTTFPIYVFSSVRGVHLAELQSLMNLGFTGRFSEQKFQIHGIVKSKNDSHLLASALGNPDMIDHTSMSQEFFEITHAQLVQSLGRHRVIHQKNRIAVLGQPNNPLEHQFIKQAVQEIAPHIQVVNDKSIDFRPQLRLKATLMNAENRDGSQLGLQWSDLIPDIFSFQSGILRSTIQFGSALRLLEQRGVVKILSEPSLLLREGDEAELSAGGELPVLSRAGLKTVLDWKRYGLKIKIKLISVTGNIFRVQVQSQNNDLDHSSAVDGIPSITVNEFSSTFQSIVDEPLIISGLKRSEQGESAQGIPGTTSLPLINQIFGVKSTHRKLTELALTIVGERHQ